MFFFPGAHSILTFLFSIVVWTPAPKVYRKLFYFLVWGARKYDVVIPAAVMLLTCQKRPSKLVWHLWAWAASFNCYSNYLGEADYCPAWFGITLRFSSMEKVWKSYTVTKKNPWTTTKKAQAKLNKHTHTHTHQTNKKQINKKQYWPFILAKYYVVIDNS